MLTPQQDSEQEIERLCANSGKLFEARTLKSKAISKSSPQPCLSNLNCNTLSCRGWEESCTVPSIKTGSAEGVLGEAPRRHLSLPATKNRFPPPSNARPRAAIWNRKTSTSAFATASRMSHG